MDFVDRDALEACIQEVTDGVHAEGRRIAEAKGRTYLPEANGLRVRKALEDAGLLRQMKNTTPQLALLFALLFWTQPLL